MLDENNTNNTEPEQLLESDATAPQETTEENVKKDEGSSSRFGSAIGLFMAVPVGIYSYINSPSRYSAEKLEKTAYQYASKQVNAAKKSKRELTPEEHTTIYDKALLEYYGKFARGYRNRADQLAQGSSNKYLLAAIENENNRKEAPIATKNKAQSKASIPTLIVPVGSENVKKDLSAFAEKFPSAKLPFGGVVTPRADSASGPSIPSAPNNTPARQNQRRGGANPLNQLSNDLSSLKNAVNIARSIWASPALGVFIFIIALCGFVGILSSLLGGGGGVTTGGGNPPVGGQSAYAFVALGDSLTAWPCNPTNTTCTRASNYSPYIFSGQPWPSYLAAIDQTLVLKNNAGFPAQTTTYMLSQFDSAVKAYSPNVLFVLGGTNDWAHSIDNNGTITNLKAIIQDAQNANIKKTIILTIPHQCAPSAYSSLNTLIKGLASDYSPVIDISGASVLTCADFQQSDELHLTDSGAKKLAEYIDGQIKARNILPAPTQPVGNFHLYCQYAYKTSACNIYSYGCAPTSMAMVLTTFGDTFTPLAVGTKYGMGCTGATSYQQIKDALNSLKPGYAVAVIGPRNNNLNPDTLKTYLGKGYYVIAGGCMTGGYSDVTGHTTVITSPNTDGTFNDADPTWNSPPSHGCSTDANVHMRTLNITYPGPDLPAGTQCGDPTGAWGGWSWAFAVKKQ
jgi:lysophospholipase L1-like esterase